MNELATALTVTGVTISLWAFLQWTLRPKRLHHPRRDPLKFADVPPENAMPSSRFEAAKVHGAHRTATGIEDAEREKKFRAIQDAIYKTRGRW